MLMLHFFQAQIAKKKWNIGLLENYGFSLKQIIYKYHKYLLVISGKAYAT